MKKNKNKNDKFIKLLMIFIMIQPFFDVFVYFMDKVLNINVPFISFISSFINSSSLLLTTSIYDSNVCFKDSIFDIIFLSLPISLDKSIVSLAFHKLLSYKLWSLLSLLDNSFFLLSTSK